MVQRPKKWPDSTLTIIKNWADSKSWQCVSNGYPIESDREVMRMLDELNELDEERFGKIEDYDDVDDNYPFGKPHSKKIKEKISDTFNKSKDNYVESAYTDEVGSRDYIDNSRISKGTSRWGEFSGWYKEKEKSLLAKMKGFFMDIFYSIFGDYENDN